eukprot:scaffold41791_cov29-Tisochrysis_lutea.AAC.2
MSKPRSIMCAACVPATHERLGLISGSAPMEHLICSTSSAMHALFFLSQKTSIEWKRHAMAMVVLRRAGVDPPLREAIHAKPKPNEALVVQRAKQRNGTLDPKRAECLAELSKGALARLIGWKLNREHKVRGMTRRGEGACPTERLIYWTRVDAFAWWLTIRRGPAGRHPNRRPQGRGH